MDYLNLNIVELHKLLVNKEITPLELTKLALEKAKKDTNNAFETIEIIILSEIKDKYHRSSLKCGI